MKNSDEKEKTELIIKGINIPFIDIVKLILKIGIALIPIVIVLQIIFVVLLMIFSKFAMFSFFRGF